jgi:two-component system, NtrC family, C4-dicarboxylate transport sensor histidine kinase DctB
MLGLIESTFSNEKISIVIDETDEEIEIFGKSSEFTHAVMNIANNAKDALVSNKIENPEFRVKLEKVDSTIRITFSDNAGGIPEDVIGKIFDSYFTTKLDQGGTGLGLDLTYKVILEHLEGRINVDNSNDGAVFIIEFDI